jgi:predicted PurR-regulated permease PerM
MAQLNNQNTIVNTFFIIVFLGVFLLFGQLALPFLTPVIIAMLLGVIFYPLFKKVAKLVNGNEAFAALIMCFLITLLVVVPFGVFVGLLSSEAFNFYVDTRSRIESGYYQELIEDNAAVLQLIQDYGDRFNVELDFEAQRDNVLNAAQNLGLIIYERAGGFVGDIAQGLFNFVTILFLLYYFFKDHKKITSTLLRLSPLPDKIEIDLIRRVADVGKAVFFGNMVTALVQGILGGIGFFAAGFSNSLFWATLVGVSSLIPSVGVFLVTIPASLIFFIQGEWVVGSIFLAYNVIIVGSVDNILKPKLIESKINLHPILVFVGVLGGLLVFGPMGVIYGPLIVTLFVAFVGIYEKHFRDGTFFDEKVKKKNKKTKTAKAKA